MMSQKKLIKRFFLLILAVCLQFTFPISCAYAYTVDENTSLPLMKVDGVTYPDWQHLSLANIGPAPEDGGFSLANQNFGDYTSEDVINFLGYDPSRTWHKGDSAASLLRLGDFSELSDWPNWSINTLQQLFGLDLGGLRLSDFSALASQSLEDLVTALPQLGLSALGDVHPVFDAVSSVVGGAKALQYLDTPIKDLGNVWDVGNLDFEISDVTLETLDLSQYSLSELPGIETAEWGDFVGWKGFSMDQIPGLQYVPIAKLIWGVLNGGFLGKVDIVFGEKEANRTNTISGSFKAGFNVPCNQDNCAHIELTDAFHLVTPILRGKQWISGKSQQVEGGSKLLGMINNGKEPTGRHPFGDFFKVVLTDVDESKGLARFGIYFRFCGKPKWLLGCSPYIIGPLPWFSHLEKDLVFVGVDGIYTDSVYGTAPGYPGLPDALKANPLVQNRLEGYSDDGQGNFAPPDDPSHYSDTSVDTLADDCTRHQGVDLGAFRRAIATQESGGDYYAVGPDVCADNHQNCGNALGKYQYMTYRPEIVELFSVDEEGRQILKNSDNRMYGQQDPRLKSAIKQYFPPEVQERVRNADFKKMITEAAKQSEDEEQIVRQVAFWHYNGINGGLAGNGAYEKSVVGLYRHEKKKTPSICGIGEGEGTGQCTGVFREPAPGYSRGGAGSQFGACRPLGSCRRPHAGLDYPTPIGVKIVASDGGMVEKVGWEDGYGRVVLVKHCKGYFTRYAHLNRPLVKRGQKVSQGQVIAESGNTGLGSGPHLHFEIRRGGIFGTPLDPEKMFNKAY